MILGLGQINNTIGDFDGNVARMLDGIRQAAAAKVDLLLFPELAVCGYPPRDLLLRRSFVDANLAALERLAAEVRGMTVIAGYVDRNPGVGRPLRNSAAVIRDGKIVHRVHKTLLPTYDVFDEDRYFEPAESVAPLEIGGEKVGVTICEDIWNDEDFWSSRLYRKDPVRSLKEQGIGLLVNISASPWHLGKERLRRGMLETLARNDQLTVAYCNAVGGNDELIFDGGSLVLGPGARRLAEGRAFEEDLVVVDSRGGAAEAGGGAPEDMRQLFCALRLGLRDYVRKCGFRSVVLGLSGGIDSALTAALAVAALGREQVMGLAMPSRFSSEGSVVDARELAARLGIRCETVAIEPMVQGYRAALAPLFAGRAEDTTEENLQARIRGALLMAVSNKFGSLLLTTGNKSELATGYCTLYGDMCGGLAVISDLSKTQVYALARWINAHPVETGLAAGTIPESSITKAPSAELRPNQKDQDTLPPYDWLDQVLQVYVEEHQSPQELVRRGFEEKRVREVARKIDANEYKRRQAAPGLKVTGKAFGIGRRFPIAQRYREV